MVGSGAGQMQSSGNGPPTRRLIRDPDQRKRWRFHPTSEWLLSRHRQSRTDRLHKFPGQWVEIRRTALHDGDHHAEGPSDGHRVCRLRDAQEQRRNRHEEMGFYDGWGTVAEQLAKLVQ